MMIKESELIIQHRTRHGVAVGKDDIHRRWCLVLVAASTTIIVDASIEAAVGLRVLVVIVSRLARLNA